MSSSSRMTKKKKNAVTQFFPIDGLILSHAWESQLGGFRWLQGSMRGEEENPSARNGNRDSKGWIVFLYFEKGWGYMVVVEKGKRERRGNICQKVRREIVWDRMLWLRRGQDKARLLVCLYYHYCNKILFPTVGHTTENSPSPSSYLFTCFDLVVKKI